MVFDTSGQHLQAIFSHHGTNGTFNRPSKFMQILQASSDLYPIKNYSPPLSQRIIEVTIEDISPPSTCSLCKSNRWMSQISHSVSHTLSFMHLPVICLGSADVYRIDLFREYAPYRNNVFTTHLPHTFQVSKLPTSVGELNP
jgi:hypothetical protein